MTRMKLNQISIRKLRAMLKATERAGFGDCQSVALIRREITRRQRPKRKRKTLAVPWSKGGIDAK